MHTEDFDLTVVPEVLAEFRYENIHTPSSEIACFFPDFTERFFAIKGLINVQAQKSQKLGLTSSQFGFFFLVS